MKSELVQALDRLRESVDALRATIVEATGPNPPRPGQAYLDEIQEMRARGLIDETAFANKKRAFLDKF